MEKSSSSECQMLGYSIPTYLLSFNTFYVLSSRILTFLLSYFFHIRCLFVFYEDYSNVQPEPRNTSSDQDHCKKQENHIEQEIDDGWFVSGYDVNTVMKRLGLEKHGLLGEREVQKRWGRDEISRVFDEEEVRMEEVREAFKVFDQDEDGFIDARELQRVLLALGLTQGAELQACRKMINVFDKDGDGKIDIHDFVRLFNLE